MKNILIGYLVDHSLLILTENSKYKYSQTYAAISNMDSLKTSKNLSAFFGGG